MSILYAEADIDDFELFVQHALITAVVNGYWVRQMLSAELNA